MKLLQLFMLRRVKKDTLKDVPPKEETLVEVELTAVQKKYYRALLEKNRAVLVGEGGAKKGIAPKLNNLFMQLNKEDFLLNESTANIKMKLRKNYIQLTILEMLRTDLQGIFY